MSFKKKVAYFWEYYRFHLLGTVIFLVIAINIITSIANQKPYSFYGMMLNAYELDNAQLQSDFGAFAGLDGQEAECYIDTQSMLDIESLDQFNIASIQRVLALVAVGDLDAFISDGPTFAYFAEGEIFMDLRTVLSPEEIARYEDLFLYIDQAELERRKEETNISLDDNIATKSYEEKLSDLESRRYPAEMADPIPVGIFVDEAAFIKATGVYPLYAPVYGISASSQRLETARLYLEFLFAHVPTTNI
jgi:hypothetical protein